MIEILEIYLKRNTQSQTFYVTSVYTKLFFITYFK